MRKYKIILLTGFFYPRTGGVEKVVNNLSKELAKNNMEVAVITKKYSNELKERESMGDVKIYRIPMGNGRLRLLYLWKWVYKNRKMILENDILQFHDVSTFVWCLPIILKVFKKPRFIVFHGYESYPIKSRYKILRLIISKSVDNYACVSKSLENFYPVKSKNVFYNGVKKVNVGTKKTKDACFISRIESDTFLLDYLRGLKLLREKYNINFKLDVYGDGSLKNECEDYVKENKLNVEFKGFIRNADKFLKDYKYSFATQYLSVLESMASGTLVISMCKNRFREDFAKEILNNGELGVILKNPEDFSDKIDYYEKNKKEYDKKIQMAANFAKKSTWDKLVKEMFIPIYKKLIKKYK